jgi:hypothetical protein
MHITCLLQLSLVGLGSQTQRTRAPPTMIHLLDKVPQQLTLLYVLPAAGS